MGTFKVKCPSCNQKLEADEALEGMELPCPKCNHLFSLHKPIPQLRISADEHLVQDDTKPIIPETTTKNPITGNSIHEPSTEENPIKDSTATEKPVNVLQLEQLTLPALKKLYIRSQWLVVFGVLCIILSLASIGLAFFVSLKFLLALPALLLASFIFIKSRSMAARILFFFIGGGLTLYACIGISMTWLDALKSSHSLAVPGAFAQSIGMLIWVLIFSGIFLSACQRTLFGSNGFSHRQIAFVYKRRKKNLTFTAEELPIYKRTSRKTDMIATVLFVVTAFSAWAIAFSGVIQPTFSISSKQNKSLESSSVLQKEDTEQTMLQNQPSASDTEQNKSLNFYSHQQNDIRQICFRITDILKKEQINNFYEPFAPASLAMYEFIRSRLAENNKYKDDMSPNIMGFAVQLCVFPELYAVEKRGLRQQYIEFLKSKLYHEFAAYVLTEKEKNIKKINQRRQAAMKAYNIELGEIYRSPEYWFAFNILLENDSFFVPEEPLPHLQQNYDSKDVRAEAKDEYDQLEKELNTRNEKLAKALNAYDVIKGLIMVALSTSTPSSQNLTELNQSLKELDLTIEQERAALARLNARKEELRLKYNF